MPAKKGNKYAQGNPGGGRKTIYKKEYAGLAKKFCLLGATDAQLAEMLDVSVQTINVWKIKHEEFRLALKEGKGYADANVASSLYQRALGYKHDDVHVSNYQGEITLTPIVKHYPPDTTAGIFWLKNRQKAKWRDKTEQEVVVSGKIDEISTDELLSIISGGGK